jgi:hypothetical protein
VDHSFTTTTFGFDRCRIAQTRSAASQIMQGLTEVLS